MRTRQQLNTAGRLVAAIVIGISSCVILLTYESLLDDLDRQLPRYFIYYNAILCVIVGWNTLGSRPGYGGWPSVRSGLRSISFTVIIISLLHGFAVICSALLHGIYFDPFETIFDWFEFSFEFFVSLLSWQVLVAIVLCGAVSGRLTGMANARWP